MKKCKKCNQEKSEEQFTISNLSKDGLQLYCKECRTNYYHEHKEKMNLSSKKFYENNLIYVRKKMVENITDKLKSDPLYKAKHYLYMRVRQYYKQAQNPRSFTKSGCDIENILGCDKQEFKTYIENQFNNQMSFENYNKYWELDHIIPLAKATNIEELKLLFHYTNYRPLRKDLNRKRNRFLGV